MTRFIDADALKEEVWKAFPHFLKRLQMAPVFKLIREAPTIDAVPVIRCKDCKFWRTYAYVNGRPKFLPKCGYNQIYVNGEDFCSRAERRENDKR